MANESITIYKLIILYTLNKVNSPLPSGIISDYIIEKGYTNFFTLQNAFGELLQAELIAEDATYHLAYYTLTDTGRETLELFGSQLSYEIKKEIDDYLREKRYDIIDETSFISDYQRTVDGSYQATCTLRDGSHVLYQITLDVATEQDAIKVCENWRDCSTELYQQSMLKLLSH